MSKSTNQRQPRSARAHANPAFGKALPLRRTWPINLCIGLALGSIVFSGNALAGGPTGGVVVGGSGSITQSGNSTVINQASNKLALNWQTFNVAANESVLFNQPSRSAVALNRILDQNPSQIFGKINSNGQIFLINTHGIIFGATAQMNVGGLLASTLDLTPNDFLAGHYNLNAAGAGAGIVNHGLIQAASGGSVSLVGGSVLNDGVIFANYGKINLDGADHAVLDFDGNGLINIQITGELKKRLDAKEAAVTNKGALRAEDGTVVLQASATKDLFTNLVNNAGVIDASGISTDGGVVRLVGRGGNVENSGNINVSGMHGGSAQMLSDQDVNVSGSVDASGTLGGGDIRIGGGQHGGEGLLASANSTLGAGATLNADATQSGNGGSVVVWGNRSSTIVGSLSARGGVQGGNGGAIETSADHVHIADSARVNTLAPNGQAGNWLIDPKDFTIAASGGDMTGGAVATALSGGNFTILSSSGTTAGSGNINVNDAVSWGANKLTLTAANDVNINSVLTGSGTSSLVLNSATANGADAAVTGGVININKNITTGGDQAYNGPVVLGADAALASSAGGAISFNGTVNGAHALSVSTSGVTSFGGAIGGTTALTSLTTNAGGSTTLNGNATTTGAQTWGDAVTLGTDVTLAGTTVSLAGVTGAGNSLAVTGNAVLAGAVSGVNALQVSGTTNLNTASVSTSGGQTYSGAVTLGSDATLASSGSGTIGFGSTVNGAHALTVNTSGATTFGGAIGGTTALTGLTTDAGGSTTLSDNVTTTGAQTYNDAVTLGANATLASSGGGAIGLNGTVNGAHALSVNTTGTTTFGGAIGGTTALTSLTTDVGGSTT
ncbi:MAG: beta strand repeat-containing protein, partial [Rhodanobacter sp.]